MPSHNPFRRLIKSGRPGTVAPPDNAAPALPASNAPPVVPPSNATLASTSQTSTGTTSASNQDPAQPNATSPGVAQQSLSSRPVLKRTIELFRDAAKGGPIPGVDSFVDFLAGTGNEEVASSAKEELQDIARRMDALIRIILDGREKLKDYLPDDLEENASLKSALEEVRTTAGAIADELNKRRHFVSLDAFAIQIKKLQDRITAEMYAHQLQANYNTNVRVMRVHRMQHTGQVSVPLPRVDRLPSPPAHFFGREQELESLVNVILESPPARICIRGPGGIGKSALALHFMHDPRIKDIFIKQRFFVRLDSSNNADDILAALALYLGITGDDLSDKVFDTFEKSPTPYLLTLDNLESPWDSEYRTAVEALLLRLSGLQNVTLIITIRGVESPSGIKWTDPRLPPLKPLTSFAAADLLSSIAQQRSPDWDKLLQALDYVPLAITLVSQLAEAGEKPDILLQRWQTERTFLLQRSSHPDKHSSVAISIQLSLTSPRMVQHPHAHELLCLLSLLPDGIQEGELVLIMHDTMPNVSAMVSTLSQVALLYKEDQTLQARIRVLSPIRAFMNSHHSVLDELQKPLMSHYLVKAAQSNDVWNRAYELLPLLTPEVGNIQAMFSLALQTQPDEEVLEALIAFAQFTRLTNLGGTSSLEVALTWLSNGNHRLSNPDAAMLYEARCLKASGDIHLQRSELDEALSQYTEAMELFRSAGDPSGQWYCLSSIAGIHLQRSQLDEALSCYTEALELFRSVGDLLGQASCLLGMADIDLQRSQLDEAFYRYTEALELFESASEPHGQANCLLGMGHIHLWRSQLDEANSQYTEALELFSSGGGLLGQGTCLKGIGDIYMQRSQLDEAFSRYTEALELFRSAGDPVWQGNVLKSMADICVQRAWRDETEKYLSEALHCYEAAGLQEHPYAIQVAKQLHELQHPMR